MKRSECTKDINKLHDSFSVFVAGWFTEGTIGNEVLKACVDLILPSPSLYINETNVSVINKLHE